MWISLDVCRSLWVISRNRTRTDDQGFTHAVTVDEFTDELLREVIKEKYPQVLEHHKQVAKMEQELIKTLGVI
jgi:hypothetical protein